MGTIRRKNIGLKDGETVPRMMDFLCLKCSTPTKPYIFEEIVDYNPRQPILATCPKCKSTCERVGNQKPVSKHLSWRMWDNSEMSG